ncbi:hypothetical protein Ciccas_003738 [Cichlidogyrus casuarinus]|uniref:SAP domain-containing protein n=1 Tax=Cichlidogyrus casuarinus TaxID=1844966 RepID=A0ABD2QDI9_9PLAT
MSKSLSTFTLPDGRILSSLKVNELKEVLEAYHLSKSGNKKELVNRIFKHFNNLDTSIASSNDPNDTLGDQESFTDEPIQSKTEVKEGDHLNVETEEVPKTSIQSSPAKVSHSPMKSPAKETGQEPPLEELETENANDEQSSTDKPVSGSPSNALVSQLKTPEVVRPSSEFSEEQEEHQKKLGKRKSWGKQDCEPPTKITASVLEKFVTEADEVIVEPEKKETLQAEEIVLSDSSLVPSPKLADEPLPQRLSTVSTSKDEPEEEDYGDEEVQPTMELIDLSKETPIITNGVEKRNSGIKASLPERVSEPESARNEQTKFLFIRNLVRPFTVHQLKRMLEDNFGEIIDLVLNKLKSCGFVEFPSVESAAKAREALDGTRWPSISPQTLRLEFATEELCHWMRKEGAKSDRPPPIKMLYPSKRATIEKVLPTSPEEEESVSEKISLTNFFNLTKTEPPIYWKPLSEEEAEAQKKRRIEEYAIELKRQEARQKRSPFDDSRRRSKSPRNRRRDR